MATTLRFIVDSKTDHFDPGKMAVTVLRGSENDSSYLGLLSMRTVLHQELSTLCVEHSPLPDYIELHLLEGLGQINNQSGRRIGLLSTF